MGHTVQTVVLNLAAKMLTIKMETEGEPARCMKAELPASMTYVQNSVWSGNAPKSWGGKYRSTLSPAKLECVNKSTFPDDVAVDGIGVFEAWFPDRALRKKKFIDAVGFNRITDEIPASWIYSVSAA